MRTHLPMLVLAMLISIAGALLLTDGRDGAQPGSSFDVAGGADGAGGAGEGTGEVAGGLVGTVTLPSASVVRPAAAATHRELAARPAARRSERPAARPPMSTTTAVEGWVVAGGGSADPVTTGGRTVTWTLEVEPSTGLGIAAVLATAEAALYDGRSWAATHEFVRVDDPRAADVRVLVATPTTVDRLCEEAGFDTNGWLSCWTGAVAAINVDRWVVGTAAITDIDLYRAYVVNHEVGHGLDFGHVPCPGTGALAPVMHQQTLGLDGCVANPWPHPDAAHD